MRKTFLLGAFLLLTIAFSVNAVAAPISPTDSATGTPNLFDAVNQLLGTTYTDNDDITTRQTNFDEVWVDLGGDEPWAIIGLSAGYLNTFGIYTDVGVGNDKNPLWTGSGFGYTGDGQTAASAFSGNLLTNVVSSGSSFGFYLYSNQTNYIYSETALNQAAADVPNTKAGDWDYMTTYALPELVGQSIWVNSTNDPTKAVQWTINDSAFLVGFEDIMGGGDMDFNDTMFLVTQVKPVPEPATMILLGVGLVGLAGVCRKKYVS